MADRLTVVADKYEISELMHLRARAADRHDAELAKSCYHPDATEDHGTFTGPALAFISTTPTGNPDHPIKQMWHGIVSVQAEVDGDTGYSESYYVALVSMTVDGEDHDSIVAGRYLDRVERYEGRWVIRHRTVTFDWSRVDRPGPRYWDVRGMDPATVTFGTFFPDDPFYVGRPS